MFKHVVSGNTRDFSLQPPLQEMRAVPHTALSLDGIFVKTPFLGCLGEFFEKLQVFFILYFCFKTLLEND